MQPLHSNLAEVRQEIRDDEELIFSARRPACALYSASDAYSLRRYICVTFSIVLVEITEAVLDLRLLRPDAAVDQALLKIREVHDAGKILAKADGVKNRERQSSGRALVSRRKTRLFNAPMTCSCPEVFVSNKTDACVGTEICSGTWSCQCPAAPKLFPSTRLRKTFPVHGERAELRRVQKVIRHPEGIPALRIPHREQFLRFDAGLLQRGERWQHDAFAIRFR